MDKELLRLGLVNHAIAHGIGHEDAWPLVDQVLAEATETDVKVLADRVRERATDTAWPEFASR